jgi:hypothetical protein
MAQHMRHGGHSVTRHRGGLRRTAVDCHVIPNGIDLDHWHPTNAQIGRHGIWYGTTAHTRALRASHSRRPGQTRADPVAVERRWFDGAKTDG